MKIALNLISNMEGDTVLPDGQIALYISLKSEAKLTSVLTMTSQNDEKIRTQWESFIDEISIFPFLNLYDEYTK